MGYCIKTLKQDNVKGDYLGGGERWAITMSESFIDVCNIFETTWRPFLNKISLSHMKHANVFTQHIL